MPLHLSMTAIALRRTMIDGFEPTLPLLLLAAAVLIALVALVASWARVLVLVRRERARGSELSEAPVVPDVPLTCLRSNGESADPLNVRVVAEPQQLSAALVAAGWYRADEVTLVTSTRIVIDTILARPYSTAPVSDLYLYGRRQDYAFQFPGRDVRERDHVRFWDTGLHAEDGRPLWVGAATRDVAVKLAPGLGLPTHQISPKVDAERDFLVESLAETGWIVELHMVPGFGANTIADNGYGDVYFTDGMVALMVLADVPVLLPFTDKVRGPTVGVARVLARASRWRLPKVGRARSRAVREARRQADGAAEEPGPIRPSSGTDEAPATAGRGEA